MNMEKIMKAITALTNDRNTLHNKIDKAYDDYEAAQRKGVKYVSDLRSDGTVSEESYESMEQIYSAVKAALPDTYTNGHSLFIPTADDGMFIEVHVGMTHGVKAGNRRYETISDAKDYTNARAIINSAARLKKAEKLLTALEAFADAMD